MMRNMLIAAGGLALCALLSAPCLAQGGGNPIDELKKILKLMRVAEKQLAAATLEQGSAAQKKAIAELMKAMEDLEAGSEAQKKAEEELRRLTEGAGGKQDEVVKRLSRQLKDIEARMKKIVDGIDAIVQDVKMSQGQGGSSQLDIKNKNKSKSPKKGGKRKDESKGLKKTGKKGEKKGASQGEKESDSKGDAAKRAYEAKRKDDRTAARRKALGRGRWGNLPPKLFADLVHPEDFTIPRKYAELVKKYFTLLGKESSKK